MPTHAVRFYTAQVLLGLDALHSNGYVYRCGTPRAACVGCHSVTHACALRVTAI